MHLTPLDLLLFGLVVFAAWRMFGNRKRPGPRPPDQPRPGTGPDVPGDDEEDRRRQASEAYRRAQAAWDHLRSDTRPPAGQAPRPDSAPAPAAPSAPAQDGDAAFLEGAKAMYARVRESWGDRDLDDLAQFLTDRCLDEFRKKAAGEPSAGRTDVLLVEAQLLAMAPEEARVRYSALIREANLGDAPRQVREDWTFRRPAGQPDAMWKLDAMAETGLA